MGFINPLITGGYHPVPISSIFSQHQEFMIVHECSWQLFAKTYMSVTVSTSGILGKMPGRERRLRDGERALWFTGDFARGDHSAVPWESAAGQEQDETWQETGKSHGKMMGKSMNIHDVPCHASSSQDSWASWFLRFISWGLLTDSLHTSMLTVRFIL